MPKLPMKPSLPPRAAPVQIPKPVDLINGRFRLRSAQTSDATNEIASWMSDPIVIEGLNMSGQAMGVDHLRQWIAGFDQVRKNLLTIRTLDGNLPVGFVMFDVEPRHRIGSFHLLIGSAEHRRGSASLSAIRSTLRHLFIGRGVGKVSIEPLSRNRSVVQFCEWLGFRLEGVLKSHRLDLKSGERLDQHIFGMTRQEYDAWPWR